MKNIFAIFVFTSLLIFSCAQKNDDENAIKKLLEKESATWRSGDIKAHASCWQIKPYSKVVISTSDGNLIDVPPSFMVNPPPNSAGHGGSSINTNYTISINGNSAWAGHNEESTSADGKKNYTYEFRMLEKINGEWKIVAQSIHAYKPKEKQ